MIIWHILRNEAHDIIEVLYNEIDLIGVNIVSFDNGDGLLYNVSFTADVAEYDYMVL